MDTNNHPGLAALAEKVLGTGLGALRNRGELLLVEWQEEKARLTELLVLAVCLIFLAVMAMMLLTATIIFLFPQAVRVWVAAGFTVLYLGGAAWAVFGIKSLVKREPFSETLNQVKKDKECLESLR